MKAMRCRIANLEEGYPTISTGMLRLEHALSAARADGIGLLKLIHGYGSSGRGGALRDEVRRALAVRQARGEIRGFIAGENFRPSDVDSWALVRREKQLRQDRDFGVGNRGITLVLL